MKQEVLTISKHELEVLKKLKGSARLLTPGERKVQQKMLKGKTQSEIFRMFGLD